MELAANVAWVQVEPFNRALVETEADVMINGRRQDHGFERAQLEVRHCSQWKNFGHP